VRAPDDDTVPSAGNILALPPAPDVALTAAPAASTAEISPPPAGRENVVAEGLDLPADPALESSGYVSLDDLVETYQALRRATKEQPPGAAGSAADSPASRFAAQLRVFQTRHGDVIEIVFCKELAAGVVLTQRRTPSQGLDGEILLSLPTATHWPEWIAALLLDCYALQMQIRQCLRGSDRSACLRTLFFLMGQALRLLEAEEARHLAPANARGATAPTPPAPASTNGKRKKKAAGLPAQLVAAGPEVALSGVAVARPADDAATQARRQRLYAGQLQELRAVVARSATRRAQTLHALGMLFGALLLGVVAIVLVLQPFLTASAQGELQRVVACGVAGAAGAIVSVLQRLTWRKLHLADQAGARSLLLAGTFRPIVGATLALAMYLFLAAGLLPLAPPHPDDLRQEAYFFAAIAFVAAFGERFAQDTLSISQPAATGPGAGGEGSQTIATPVAAAAER